MDMELLRQVTSKQCKTAIQKYQINFQRLLYACGQNYFERLLENTITRAGTIRIQPQKKLVAKFEMGIRACAILVLGEVPMLVREVLFNLEFSALNLRERKSC